VDLFARVAARQLEEVGQLVPRQEVLNKPVIAANVLHVRTDVDVSVAELTSAVGLWSMLGVG
jgi:hypothetical protein